MAARWQTGTGRRWECVCGHESDVQYRDCPPPVDVDNSPARIAERMHAQHIADALAEQYAPGDPAPPPEQIAMWRALAEGAEDEHTATLHPHEVIALLDALTRAEARAEARAIQTAYWRERAGQPHERVAIP